MRESELKFFEDMLLTRKDQIEKNIDGVEEEMNQMQNLELNDEADHASASNNSLVETAISSQQKQELLEIESALDKLKSDQYGICEMCEELIGVQRLKVKPHAKYCIDCREIAEKNN